MANRPATCASCGKRLSKKQWYYRNGQYFCKPRCWETAKGKARQEDAKHAEVSTPAPAEKTDAAAVPAPEAPAT